MKNKIGLRGVLLTFIVSLISSVAFSADYRKILDLYHGNWGNLYYAKGILYFTETRQNLLTAVSEEKVSNFFFTYDPMQAYRPAPQEMISYGNRLFVSTTGGIMINVINTNTLKLEKEIDLSPELIGPSALALDGNTLYISDTGTRKILTLNAQTLGKGTSFDAGPGPVQMVASQGKLFIISSSNITNPSGRTLRVLNAKTGTQLLNYIPSEHQERGNYSSIFRRPGGKVYVLSAYDRMLLEFDPDTLDVTRIPLLSTDPVGIIEMNGSLIVLDRGSLDAQIPPTLEVVDLKLQINLAKISKNEIYFPSALVSSPDGKIYIRSLYGIDSNRAILSEITNLVPIRSDLVLLK